MQRREQTRQHAGHNDEAGDERDDRSVEREIDALWDGRRQRERRKQTLAPCGDDERHGTARDGEDQPFGDELAHEASTARAERRANAHLLLALDTSRDEQARQVEAREQQHESRAGHRAERNTGQAAKLGMAVAHQHEPHAAPFVRGRKLAREGRGRARKAPLGLRDAHARCDTSNQAQPAMIDRGQRVRQPEIPPALERRPHLGCERPAGPAKALGDDAHHGVVDAVQREVEASDRRRIESPPPEPFADDDFWHRRARGGPALSEVEGKASGDGLHVDQAEVVGGDDLRPDRLARRSALPRERHASQRRGVDCAARGVGEPLELRERHIAGAAPWARRHDPDGAIDVRHRVALQKQRIDAAEDDGVQAHADGQRENRCRGVERPPRELAPGESKILGEGGFHLVIW